MNEEKRIHKFLNKDKDKKIYDVLVDRYVTVGFLNSVTMEKARRKHPRLNYFIIPILLQHFLLKP